MGLSSIESTILELAEDYDQIINGFEKKVDPEDEKHMFKEVSESEILSFLRGAMKFQRKIEYVLEQVEKSMKAFPEPHRGGPKGEIIVSEEEYARMLNVNIEEAKRRLQPTRRLNKIGSRIIDVLTTDKRVDDHTFYYNKLYIVRGTITNLKNAIENLRHNHTTKARRYCYCAYFAFKKIIVDLIEMTEELRLIAAMTAFPIEKKLEIKDKLISEKFEGVVESLEEAESNVIENHLRDCISRCRDAVEIFIAKSREQITGEETEKKFTRDLSKLVENKVVDDSEQRLIKGVYSFLSLKGSHKYDESKISANDAELALDSIYSTIGMLLRKHSAFMEKSRAV